MITRSIFYRAITKIERVTFCLKHDNYSLDDGLTWKKQAANTMPGQYCRQKYWALGQSRRCTKQDCRPMSNYQSWLVPIIDILKLFLRYRGHRWPASVFCIWCDVMQQRKRIPTVTLTDTFYYCFVETVLAHLQVIKNNSIWSCTEGCHCPGCNNVATSSRHGCNVIIAHWTMVSLNTVLRLSWCLASLPAVLSWHCPIDSACFRQGHTDTWITNMSVHNVAIYNSQALKI